MREPLRNRLATIIGQGSDDHEATVDRILDEMLSVSRHGFIANASKWLEQVKDGKEMRL